MSIVLQMQSSSYQSVFSNTLNGVLTKIESRIDLLEAENTELKTKLKRMENSLRDGLRIVNAMKKEVIPDYGKQIEQQQSAHTNHFDFDSYNLDSSISSSSSLKRQYEYNEYYEDRYGNKNIDKDSDKYKDIYHNELEIHKAKKICSRIVSDPRLDIIHRKTMHYSASDNSSDNLIDNSIKPVREYPMHTPASKIDLPQSDYEKQKRTNMCPKTMLCFKNICNNDCNFAHSINELAYCNRTKCNGFCNSLLHCKKDYDILKAKIDKGEKLQKKCEIYGSNPSACDPSKCSKIHHNRSIRFDAQKC